MILKSGSIIAWSVRFQVEIQPGGALVISAREALAVVDVEEALRTMLAIHPQHISHEADLDLSPDF